MASDIRIELGGKLYECVLSVPYTENYNETLDSITCVIKHISEKIEIKPYDMATIYRGDSEWLKLLVDTTNCTRKRYTSGDTYYEYTIELMSETKWLEKIQLPNRSFTHDLNGEYRNAYNTIYELMYLYVPKVVRNDKVVPLIGISDHLKAHFLDKSMKDIQMSKPTLRQALTAVMSQFGCIPVVKNEELDYVDFNEETGTFTDSDVAHMDSEVWTNSSDSYVNTLRSNLGQLTGGVATEYGVTFRNRDTGLLSETGNLVLNTTMPIYKIRKVLMSFSALSSDTTHNIVDVRYMNYASENYLYNIYQTYLFHSKYEYYPIEITKTTDTVTVSIYFNQRLDNVVIDELKSNFDGYIRMLAVERITHRIKNIGTMIKASSITSDVWNTRNTKLIVTYENVDTTKEDTWVFFLSQFSIDGSDVNIVWNEYVMEYGVIGDLHTTSEKSEYDYVHCTYHNIDNIDISPMIKTAEERKLLSYDYTDDKFENPTSVDDIAKFYYSTFQYSVGGTTIEGFSDTYNLAVGWWNETHGVIDNVMEKFLDFAIEPWITKIVLQFYPSWTWDLSAVKLTIGGYKMLDKDVYGMQFTIEYEPLADIDLVNVKDSFDVPLSQLDNSSNSVTDMNSFMLVEHDKIDRLGNPIHILGKRYSGNDLDSLIKLGARNTDTDEIVYKRVITMMKDYMDVAYYLCKDYVITNYSTAVSTKYRAYQYVDYSSAIQRNESRISYLVIDDADSNAHNFVNPHTCAEGEEESVDTTYYGGISFSNIAITDVFIPFISDANVHLDFGYKRIKEYAQDSLGYYWGKGMVFALQSAIMTYPKGLAIAFKEWDTVSAGIMIESDNKDTGRPQHAYMRADTSTYADLSKTDIGLLSYKNDDAVAWDDCGDSLTLPSLSNDELVFDAQILRPHMSIDMDGMVQDQSELLCFTQQIEFRSFTDNCKVFDGIEQIARIGENKSIAYKYVSGFNNDDVTQEMVINPFRKLSDSDIAVDGDVTVYANDKKIATFRQGAYTISINIFNKAL